MRSELQRIKADGSVIAADIARRCMSKWSRSIGLNKDFDAAYLTARWYRLEILCY